MTDTTARPEMSAQETWREDERARRCPQCNRVNPATAHFCTACGAGLYAVCSACGQMNAPESRFCSACGAHLTQPMPAAPAPRFAFPASYTQPHLAEKILTSRSALTGERKQVTVLFCDIADSSGLAVHLGAEAMHSLLNAFFELALSTVHQYEGTINQFLGDGFMALFGAPIAHEDHARRAVLAAIGLHRHLVEDSTHLGQPYGVRVTVRMGLHTGHVIVGAIGDNLRMDYTAVGDTTNIAAHLQQAAAPGQIIISEATHHLVSGYCTTRPLGDVSLKGKAAPMRAWEVQTVYETRTRLEVQAEHGLTRFVDASVSYASCTRVLPKFRPVRGKWCSSSESQPSASPACFGKGDYEQARTALEEGLALAEKLDNKLYSYRMLNTLGWLHSEFGDLERALDLNQQSAEGARQRDDRETIANAELNLADIFLIKGDLHLAREFLDRVYRLAHDPAGPTAGADGR